MIDNAAGASASLHMTISDLMAHLGKNGKRPKEGLRDYLYELIGDYGEKNYRRGFNRGHQESAKSVKKNGKVPKVLRYIKTREFFHDGERTVRMKSTLR
jgi:hypothetical protein